MALKNNTWTLNNWYDQDVAGNVKYTTSGDNHELWVWGHSDVGVLGLNSTGNFISSPVQIPGTTWSSICGSMGNAYWMVATKTDNTLWAWGYNQYGNLGLNNRTEY